MSKVAKLVWLPRRGEYNEESYMINQLQATIREAMQPHLDQTKQMNAVIVIEVLPI